MQNQRNEYTGAGEPAGTTGTPWETGTAQPGESTSGSRARRLRDEASQTLRSAKDKASVAYEQTADQAARAYDRARGYARMNPGVAAATTFAAGLGLGMLVGGRSVARAYRRNLLPAFGVALAQAVRNVFARSR